MFFLVLIFISFSLGSQTNDEYMSTCKNLDAVHKAINSMTPYNSDNGYKIAIIGCVKNNETVTSSFFANDNFYTITYPINNSNTHISVDKYCISSLNWTTLNHDNEEFINAIISMTYFTREDNITPLKFQDYDDYPSDIYNHDKNPVLSLRFVIFLAHNSKYIILYPLKESYEKSSVKLAEYK